MKLIKFLYVVPLAVLILIVGSGCRKGQFNINKNINSPTDSTITYFVVLPAALNATGRIVAGNSGTWGPLQNWMSFWSRSGTYAPNVLEETYTITTGFGNGVWNTCYDNNYDYNIVQIKASQAGAGFYEGIARIMKAHNFQILVDVYGDVPYTQALKGSGNPTPVYDKGDVIYKSLLREIDAGILLIRRAVVNSTNGNRDIATNDIMFNGDKTKWVKFANTLKLRMLIHTHAFAGINKAAEIAIINSTVDTTAGNAVYGYLGAGENAQINPGYSAVDKGQPFFNAYITQADGSGSFANVYYKANEWGINYYAWDGDPRISRFYVAGSEGLKGVPYGTPPIDAYAAAKMAGIGPALNKGATAPQWVLTSAESFFLQSEARFRGWITTGPSAQALMTSAINESFIFTGVPNPATAAATYIANNATYPDVDYNGLPQGTGAPAGGLFTILSQKWFALNGYNSLEIWTDWRRVAYSEVATRLRSGAAAPTSNFIYGDGGAYNGFGLSLGVGPFRSLSPQISPADNIPVRYLYPQSEYNYNAGNVPAGITRYSKVFWDVN